MKSNSKTLIYTLVISVIGLIADVITISSLNLIERKISYSEFEIFLHSKTNQQIIWFIALFAYIGIVKTYKDEIKNIPHYPLYFFIIKSPFLIIPIIILSGLLAHIWGSEIFWIIIPIGGLIIAFSSEHAPQVPLHEFIKKNEIIKPTNKEKKIIENNWESISNRIDLEVKRNQWVHHSHLKDLKDVYGISNSGIDFLLKKYSVEKPDKVRFGNLYVEVEEADYEIRKDVLISLDNIEEKYKF